MKRKALTMISFVLSFCLLFSTIIFTTTSSAATSSDAYSKYPTPVTVKLINFTYDALENGLKTINETFEDNRWTKLFKNRLNIDVKYMWIAANQDQYNQKFNVMMASGDLPDIFQIPGDRGYIFKQLMETDQLADLTDAYRKYIGPEYSSVTKLDPYMLSSATFNKKLMGLAHGCTIPYSSVNVLWLRYDWLKKLKLSPPKNMNDVINIARAFKKNSPDGVPVLAGIGLDKNPTSNAFKGIVNSYHAYRDIWVDKGGKLAYGPVQPQMKDALKVLAGLYKDGIIDKEFALKDEAKVQEEIIAGKIGMIYGQMWLPLVLGGLMDKHPEADLRAYPIVSIDKKPALGETNAKVQSWNVVRKGFKNPEALIKMCNVANLVQNGKEALEKAPDGTNNVTYYTAPKGADSLYNVTNLWYNLLPDVNVYRYVIADAVINKDPSKVNTADRFIYDNMLAYTKGDKSQWGWYQTFCKDISGSAAINYAKEHNLGYIDKFNGLATPEMSSKLKLFNQSLDTSILKIIMGASPVSEFSKIITNFNKLGGMSVTKEVNDWYKVNK
jgi:putative aldouronate transport system substrate-binding protein